MGVPSGAQIAVVVVNYNGGLLLTDCIRAVLASTLPVHVVVSDNGSSDGSILHLRQSFENEPRLRIVENCANLGFARGNNVVLAQAQGEFLLFLNPDCIVQPDTLERMLAVMRAHPQAGMAGCLLINEDGSEQAGCRRHVPTPWRSMVRVFKLNRLFPRYRRFQCFVQRGQPLPSCPTPLEAISGAFMFVRRKALEEIGPLDEGYFMHCEDLDWCMRFRQAGWEILFVPDASVLHVKGVCGSSRPVRVEYYKHRGMIRFYRKFFRHQYPGVLMWMVVSAVCARFVAKAVFLTLRPPRG